METLCSNFHKQTRRETLHGREFVVAPVTLIVPGVLKGSQGALFYSASEIAASTDSWNGMPITLRHPQDTAGHSVSGRTPAINEKQGIGTVYNSRTKDGKLIGEAWFDLEATRELAPAVAESLERNEPIELSTGLFTDNKKAAKDSQHKGKPFSFLATNIRPDHLAILTDQVGACSLEDGCGVLNVQDLKSGEGFERGPDGILHKTFSSESKEGCMSLNKEQKTELIAELIKNCEYCDESDASVLNELSDEKLLARETDMKKQILQNSIVEAVQEYAGETVEPEKLAEFVVNAAKSKKNQEEEDDEEEILRKKKLALFEKNKKHGTEENDGGKKVTANLTDDEWLAKAPEHLQNTWRYAQEIEQREKEQLVNQIVANVTDDDQKKTVTNRLKDKDLDELRDLAILTPVKEEKRLPVSFMGSQGAHVTNQDTLDPHDILKTPTIDWADDN